MSGLLALAAAAGLALLGTGALRLIRHRRRRRAIIEPGPSRILFPFLGRALSARALESALRLARAEDATLVPVFLARVSLQLPLDTPLPRQCALAIPLQEAIEQRAAAYGVAVDARIERGRTDRHALVQTIARERFDRIVIAAAPPGGAGFGADDVAWLLGHAPGEIVVLRPAEDEQLVAPPRRGRSAAPGSPPRPRRLSSSAAAGLTEASR